MERQLKSQYERTTQLGLPVIREKGGMRWWPPELAPDGVWEEVKPTPKPGEFYKLQSSGSEVLILSSSGFMKRWRAAGRSGSPARVVEGVFVLKCGKLYRPSRVSQGEIAIYSLKSWMQWQKTKGAPPVPKVGAVRWIGLAKQRYVVLGPIGEMNPLSGAVWCEALDGWQGYISLEDWWRNGTAIEPEKKAKPVPERLPKRGDKVLTALGNTYEIAGAHRDWIYYFRDDDKLGMGWTTRRFSGLLRAGKLKWVEEEKAVSEIVEHWQVMTEGPKWMHERICPDWEPEQGFEFRRCSRNGESTPLCEAVGVYDRWVWYTSTRKTSPCRGWSIGAFRQMMRDGTLVEVCDTKGDHDECAECSCVGYDE